MWTPYLELFNESVEFTKPVWFIHYIIDSLIRSSVEHKIWFFEEYPGQFLNIRKVNEDCSCQNDKNSVFCMISALYSNNIKSQHEMKDLFNEPVDWVHKTSLNESFTNQSNSFIHYHMTSKDVNKQLLWYFYDGILVVTVKLQSPFIRDHSSKCLFVFHRKSVKQIRFDIRVNTF